MSTEHFDATLELKKVRQHKSIRRRKSYQQSCLGKLRTELVLLRKEGASYREISLWLRHTKRIKTTHTTVMRYLEKLPEFKESKNAKFP
jgi:intein-encoded DNA endonuclease-like protein